MTTAAATGIGRVDAHFHVVGPADRFPPFAPEVRLPAPASLASWASTFGPLGVTHGVVVQPSFYGTDNAALVSTLAQGQGRLVGIAAVEADVDGDTLDRLVAAGVRGVRMAFVEAGAAHGHAGFVAFAAAFDALEPRLAERSLHLQLLTDSRLLPGALAERLMRSKVPVVIDHMGRAPASLGAAHEGLAALQRLMVDGPVWVKLSGAANISDRAPSWEDAAAVHQALLKAAPHRVVWGSDWPHVKPRGVRPQPEALFRLAWQWTPASLREMVFGRNAVALYRLAGPSNDASDLGGAEGPA